MNSAGAGNSIQLFQIIKPKNRAQFCIIRAGSRVRPSLLPESKKTQNPAQFRTKSEQTAKPATSPHTPGSRPPSPPVKSRPWGGDGFVRSKSMRVRNPFPANNLETREPAQTTPSRARISKKPEHHLSHQPPATNHAVPKAGKWPAWGGDGFVRSKSMRVRNPFPANNLETRKPAQTTPSRARISKKPGHHLSAQPPARQAPRRRVAGGDPRYWTAPTTLSWRMPCCGSVVASLSRRWYARGSEALRLSRDLRKRW